MAESIVERAFLERRWDEFLDLNEREIDLMRRVKSVVSAYGFELYRVNLGEELREVTLLAEDHDEMIEVERLKQIRKAIVGMGFVSFDREWEKQRRKSTPYANDGYLFPDRRRRMTIIYGEDLDKHEVFRVMD